MGCDDGKGRRRVYYISPCGTVELVTPEALEGDRDYVKDLIDDLGGYERDEDVE